MAGYLAAKCAAVIISSPDKLTVLGVYIGVGDFDGFHMFLGSSLCISPDL